MVSLEICKDEQIGVGGRGVEGGSRDCGGEAVEEWGGGVSPRRGRPFIVTTDLHRLLVLLLFLIRVNVEKRLSVMNLPTSYQPVVVCVCV